jgi:membrane-bound lytic murein transglycosylase D
VPKDLAYVALVESAFKTSALSRAKAKGMWQFVSDTGRRYGLNQDWWVDERADPEKATRAAAKYLKDLHGMFGDWNLAMAGYNAGELTIEAGIKRYKVTDFWSLSKTRAIRRETKNYVPLIHAAIVVAKAPEKYGFQVEPDRLPRFENVVTDGAVDLRFVSECTGATLDQIQLLNPSLRRMATPAGRSFDLRVPEGTGSAVATCLASTPPDRRVRFRTHVVAKGQTLSTIAGSYGIRTADLASANSMSLTGRLSIGTELIIPIDPRVAVAAARPAAATPAPATPADLPAAGKVKVSYKIKPGDTLAAIASQFGTTIQALQSWNGLRGSRIVAGDTLTIYTRSGF